MAKILVVDEDPQSLRKYIDILSLEKHSAAGTMTAMDALQRMKIEKYELLITEIELKKISGLKLIEIILDGHSIAPFPIIISSASISDDVIKRFASNSMIHFLPKPTNEQNLRDKIKDVLAKPAAKPKIDVRFINPVLNATIEVIAEMTSYTITAGKPYVKKLGETSGDISGVVGVLSSGFRGTISISLTEKTFLKLISKMFGETCTVIDDDNKDAIAEILNIIFGAAKKVLNETGMNIQPAIPTIVRGHNHSLSHHGQNQTIVIPFSNPELGEFRAEVASVG